jgi:hypothetical protein
MNYLSFKSDAVTLHDCAPGFPLNQLTLQPENNSTILSRSLKYRLTIVHPSQEE